MSRDPNPLDYETPGRRPTNGGDAALTLVRVGRRICFVVGMGVLANGSADLFGQPRLEAQMAIGAMLVAVCLPLPRLE